MIRGFSSTGSVNEGQWLGDALASVRRLSRNRFGGV
jgi:hypothetical protein